MSRPELTATVTCCVTVDPRDDLSVCQNVQVRVLRYGESWHVVYTDLTGKPIAEPDEYTFPFRSPEDAVAYGVYNVLSNVQATIREAIEGGAES